LCWTIYFAIYIPVFLFNKLTGMSHLKTVQEDCLILEDGNDSFPRSVGTELTLYAA